jgi:hypothetical protein
LPEYLVKQINVNKKTNSDKKVSIASNFDDDFDDDNSSSDSDHLEEYPNLTNSKRELLLNYAHPLIVVDYSRLESCYDQLKEIIGENNLEFDDQVLVKSIILNEYDLNRVLLNDVFNVD